MSEQQNEKIQRTGPVQPMEVVLDSYGNPAVVLRIDSGWASVLQLAGSDFGRKNGVRVEVLESRRSVTPSQIEWAKRRYAEYRSR